MKVIIIYNVKKSLWNYILALKYGMELLDFEVDTYEIDLSKPFNYSFHNSIIIWCLVIARPLHHSTKTILQDIFLKLRRSSNKIILYETERLDYKRIKWLIYFNMYVDELWTYCLYNVNIGDKLSIKIHHVPHGYCEFINSKHHNNSDKTSFLVHFLTTYRKKIVNKFNIQITTINPEKFCLNKNQINIHQHSEKNQPFESMRIGFLLSNSCNVFVDNLCKEDHDFWNMYIHYYDDFQNTNELKLSHKIDFNCFQKHLRQDKLILNSPLLYSLNELKHLQQLIVF